MIYPGLIREALYVWIKGWGVNNNQEGGWKIEKKKKNRGKNSATWYTTRIVTSADIKNRAWSSLVHPLWCFKGARLCEMLSCCRLAAFSDHRPALFKNSGLCRIKPCVTANMLPYHPGLSSDLDFPHSQYAALGRRLRRQTYMCMATDQADLMPGVGGLKTLTRLLIYGSNVTEPNSQHRDMLTLTRPNSCWLLGTWAHKALPKIPVSEKINVLVKDYHS